MFVCFFKVAVDTVENDQNPDPLDDIFFRLIRIYVLLKKPVLFLNFTWPYLHLHLFSGTKLNLYIYIYIYVCVCVCVCVIWKYLFSTVCCIVLMTNWKKFW